MSDEHPVKRLCEGLAVSRSGYYQWCQAGRRTRAGEAIISRIQAVYAASRGTYGSPRVTAALRAQLLRQCRYGGVLEHPQTRAGLPSSLPHPQRGHYRHLRLYRGLLQPLPPPFGARLKKPARLRIQPQLSEELRWSFSRPILSCRISPLLLPPPAAGRRGARVFSDAAGGPAGRSRRSRRPPGDPAHSFRMG